MTETALPDLTVQGTTWKVRISDNGWFYASTTDLPGGGPGESTTVQSDTLDDLRRKASAACSAQKVRVSIPYVRMASRRGHPELIRGEVTGIHGGTNNALVLEDGKRSQVTGYEASYLRPPTPEDEAEMLENCRQRDALEARYKELESKYRFEGGSITRYARKMVQGKVEAT